jgi:O-antigen/teichoic acid export membrane protein
MPAVAPVSSTDTPTAPTRSGRRAFWTFFDQALSSLTNVALSIVVARAVGVEEFGAFSLAVITFAFVIGLCRGLISDPFVIRYSAAGEEERRAAAGRAAGAALTFGVASGLICAGAGLLLGSDLRMALVALAISLPGLMLQDTWRHVFFAASRPAHAALNDGVWTVVQFVLLVPLVAAGSTSVFWFTLAWGGAALAAALVGAVQARVLPAPAATAAWLHETRDINLRMALDFALNMGAINLAIYLVTGIVGLAAAGALRAAQVLLGPLNMLFGGLSSFALPMMSREAGAGHSLVRSAVLCSSAIGSIATVWVVTLVLLPDSLGRRLLGASWAGAHSVMVPSGVVSLGVAFVIGAALGLKALRRADRMLRVTFIQAPVMLTLGAAGAVLWQAPGAAWGFAIAQVFGLVICWAVFLHADRQPRPWLTEPVGAES